MQTNSVTYLFSLLFLISFCCGAEPAKNAAKAGHADNEEARYKGDYVGEYQGEYLFAVSQPTALYSKSIDISFKGLDPQQVVTITADTRDAEGVLWRSEATFKANDQGLVNLATQAPLVGTYQGVSGMGLFWSMSPQEPTSHFAANKHFVVRLRALAGQQVLAQTEVRRLSPLDGDIVIEEVIRTNEFVANFYRPKIHPADNSKPLPSIIFLTGSGGGMARFYPASLAAEGFTVLSLAYFGVEPLPQKLVGLPIEYFDHGIKWLQNNGFSRGGPMAIMGSSRGSEAAVLVAARKPVFDAVILTVPSAVMWLAPGIDGIAHSAWSINGKETPYLGVSKLEGLKWLFRVTAGSKNIVTLPMFSKALKKHSKETLERVRLPIENTQAAVLFISGDDDLNWPSSAMSQMLMDRLGELAYSKTYQHLSLPNAGHSMGLPNIPRGKGQSEPTFAGGGSVSGNAAASLRGFQATVEFLQTHLGAKNK